jgi:hypothetical protein
MNILTHIFHLGVLFSAFAFLWFWIQLLLVLILPEQYKIPIRYFLQLLQSLFLGVLVLKFVYKNEGNLQFGGMLILSLITYFLYLLRNLRSTKHSIQFKVYSNLYKNLKMKNDWEWAVALISLTITIFWVFYPVALDSVVTNWFYRETHELINVAIIGWIFKIAGFFFLIGTLFRFITALAWMFNGSQKNKPNPGNQEYDDFEELK